MRKGCLKTLLSQMGKTSPVEIECHQVTQPSGYRMGPASFFLNTQLRALFLRP